jgi:primosomal protein N' (replication factor Y)
MAMLRAEAATEAPPMAFLSEVRELVVSLNPQAAVAVYGPVPAPMPRRAGKHRAQLLLQADRRAALQRLLEELAPRLGGLKGVRKVRWSLDVDPLEML